MALWRGRPSAPRRISASAERMTPIPFRITDTYKVEEVVGRSKGGRPCVRLVGAIDYCVGQIASFKVPRYVRFVSEWPTSATKVQKFRLQQQLTEELEQARTLVV